MFETLRTIPTNRIAIYLTAFANICGAIAVVLADLGTEDAVTVSAALLGISAMTHKWLDGWQKWQTRSPAVPLPTSRDLDVMRQMDRVQTTARKVPYTETDTPTITGNDPTKPIIVP